MQYHLEGASWFFVEKRLSRVACAVCGGVGFHQFTSVICLKQTNVRMGVTHTKMIALKGWLPERMEDYTCVEVVVLSGVTVAIEVIKMMLVVGMLSGHEQYVAMWCLGVAHCLLWHMVG